MHAIWVPVCMVSDGSSKFDNATVRDFATCAEIEWKIIYAYYPRGNSKFERMVGTLKQSMRKITSSALDCELDECFSSILGGYRRRPAEDGKTPFEILFVIKPSFATEPPQIILLAIESEFIRKMELALAKALRTSRVVPMIPAAWPAIYKVGYMVLVRRDRRLP